MPSTKKRQHKGSKPVQASTALPSERLKLFVNAHHIFLLGMIIEGASNDWTIVLCNVVYPSFDADSLGGLSMLKCNNLEWHEAKLVFLQIVTVEF